MIFADRTDAGKKLAEALVKKMPALLESSSDLRGSAIVLALPRGGVPVGYEIAAALRGADGACADAGKDTARGGTEDGVGTCAKAGAEFDLIVTHKLGAPGNEEFAIGAVAEDGSVFLDKASAAGVSEDYIKTEIKAQLAEIKKRVRKYRGGRPLPNLRGRTVILVDDGVATGNTMKAAIALAKNAKAKRVIVAVPVLPSDTLADLRKQAEVVYLDTPQPFIAIGRFYEDFGQMTDEEVRGCMG